MKSLTAFVPFLAELKEVVGSEEIDGWDLDADDQINESDLMEIDESFEEANQPKVGEMYDLYEDVFC